VRRPRRRPTLPVRAGQVRRGAYPILEFDPDPSALIEPSVHLCAPAPGEVRVPARAVMCFFGDVVRRIAREREAEKVAELYSEHGVHPIFELTHRGEQVAFFQPGVGAPLAALFMEEAIDYGCRAFVACGGAGALDDLALGHRWWSRERSGTKGPPITTSPPPG